MVETPPDTGEGTKMATETTLEMRTRFFEELRERGLSRMQVSGDGFCLFHSIAIGLGREGEGLMIRDEIIQFLRQNRSEFEESIPDWEGYLYSLLKTE